MSLDSTPPFVFFPVPLSHATKKLNIFLNIVCRTESLQQRFVLCIALSRCDKQNFCFLHTKFVHVAKKMPKRAKNTELFATFFITFCHFLCFWSTFWAFLKNIFCIFGMFFSFKKNTYNNFVCRSDSVQRIKQIFVTVTQCVKQYWKKYPISLWHVTKELEINPKTNILSKLNSTTDIELLWGTYWTIV